MVYVLRISIKQNIWKNVDLCWLQWWADFLDANRKKGISPFEYAKINNP